MIYIAAIRQAYERRETAEVSSVRSGDNTADAFTKLKQSPALGSFLQTARLQADIVQWVDRSSKGTEKGKATKFPYNERQTVGPLRWRYFLLASLIVNSVMKACCH